MGSTLDSLLRQSLAALASEEIFADEVRIRFDTAFDCIIRLYRAAKGITCLSIVEPSATVVYVEHRCPVRCPRLLVQCMPADAFRRRALTFAYVPDNTNRIAIDILHGDIVCRTSQFLQWTDEDGWCNADGQRLDGKTHAQAIRRVLYEGNLFSAHSLELEPMGVVGGTD